MKIRKDWDSIVHSIDDMLLVVNNDFEILDVNQNTLDLFNKPREEVIGEKCYKLIHHRDEPVDYCPLVKARETKSFQEVECFEPVFNKHFSLKSSPVFNEKGDIVKFVDLMHDITQLKTNEQKIREQNKELEALNEEYAINNEELKQREESYQRTNEALNLRERHLNSLVMNTAAYMIYRTRANRETGEIEVVKVSPSVVDLLGISEEDTQDFQKWFTHVHPEDLPKLMEASAAGMKPPFNLAIEVRYNHPEEGLKWFDVRANGLPYDDDPENIEYANGIILEITDRKRIEEENIKLHELLRNTEKIGRIGGWEFDVVSMEQNWTEETFHIMEIDTEHGEPKVPEGVDFIDQPYRDMAGKAIQEAIATGKGYDQEWVITTAKGNKKWVHSVGMAQMKNGKVVSLRGSFQDITERKRAEEKLKASEAMLKAAMDNSQAGIAIAEVPSGRLKYVNKAGLMIRDKEYDEIVKDIDVNKYVSSWQILHFDGTPYKPEDVPLARAVLNGEIVKEEFIVRRDNNEDRVVLAHAAPINDEDGDRIAAIVVFLDITEQKKLELELIQAKEKAEESDRLKSAFLANMSHEIRTPMNGILGFADLLSDSEFSGEKKSEFIDIIKKSGERLIHTINDLIDISRIESGQVNIELSDTNIEDQIDELYSFFLPEAQRKGIEFILSKPDKAAAIILNTDRDKLYSVLTNLVKNALKYTNKGRIEIGYTVKKDVVEFFVEDTGIGIPEDRQESVFDRFIQVDMSHNRPYEGSGLGLSICKAYVEMLGGEISISSEVGKGSVFTFTLTYDKKSGAAEPSPDDYKSIDEIRKEIADLKILVVEDDESSWIFLKESLNAYCKKLDRSVNGKEAVDTISKNGEYDIILMDLKMPVMDGLEATRKIREMNKQVKIIAQTAYAMEGDEKKAMDAGCNDYIAKPIKRELLLEKINALL